jgi:hypothetical protein
VEHIHLETQKELVKHPLLTIFPDESNEPQYPLFEQTCPDSEVGQDGDVKLQTLLEQLRDKQLSLEIQAFPIAIFNELFKHTVFELSEIP